MTTFSLQVTYAPRARRKRVLLRQGVAHPQTGVELVGHTRVVVEQSAGVDIGELDRAHRRESLLHAFAPQADIPYRRHDAAEDPAAEQVHRLGAIDDVKALFDRQSQPLPDFELVEPVAHVQQASTTNSSRSLRSASLSCG